MIKNTIKRLILKFLLKSVYRQAFSKRLRTLFFDLYGIKVGYGSYGGCFSVTNLPKGSCWGNYCSVAKPIYVFRANHLIEKFSTHPIFYNPIMGHVKNDCLDRKVLIVEDDVWIGANVVILPKCQTIGRGSIIGAGSVVTKDVPPYTIVAGNPAKIIKQRFNKSQIEILETSKWWLNSKDELIKNEHIMEDMLNA